MTRFLVTSNNLHHLSNIFIKFNRKLEIELSFRLIKILFYFNFIQLIIDVTVCREKDKGVERKQFSSTYFSLFLVLNARTPTHVLPFKYLTCAHVFFYILPVR